jgi:hypothetical protein
MADTFTALLRLVLQETGGNQNVWGDINNSSAIDLLEDAIAGREDVDVTLSDQTLMPANGADDPSRAAILICSGNPGTTRNVIVPSTSKVYIVTNETSPAFDVTIKTALGSGIVVGDGRKVLVFVDATLDDVVLVGAAPKATETVEGVAEIATQVEVDAGTDDERFVTPLKLATFPAANQATETVKGIAELATQAETDLGVDDERIITPLKYENRKSSEILSGHIELATQAEVDAGTDTERAVTPATLASAPTGAQFVFTGFVSSIGVGAQLPAGWSVLRNSIGIYTVTHSLGLADDNDLIIVVTAMGEPAVPAPASSNFIYGTVFNRATNSFQVLLGFPDMGTIGGAEHEDHDWNFMAIDNS